MRERWFRLYRRMTVAAVKLADQGRTAEAVRVHKAWWAWWDAKEIPRLFTDSQLVGQ